MLQDSFFNVCVAVYGKYSLYDTFDVMSCLNASMLENVLDTSAPECFLKARSGKIATDGFVFISVSVVAYVDGCCSCTSL